LSGKKTRKKDLMKIVKKIKKKKKVGEPKPET
jgi:hypothetical protein